MCMNKNTMKIKIMGIIGRRPSQREGADAIVSLMEDEYEASKDRMLANCQMNTLNTIFRTRGMGIHQAICELRLDDKKYADIAKSEGLDWVAEEIMKVVEERRSYAAGSVAA